MFLTEFMEVFEVQRIIKHLIDVRFQNLRFAHLEFKTEDDAAQKQHNVNALAEARNVILKYDPAIMIQPAHELSHDRDFALPCFAGCRARISVVMIAQKSEDCVFIFAQKSPKTIVIQTPRVIAHGGHLLCQYVMSVSEFDTAWLIQRSADCGS